MKKFFMFILVLALLAGSYMVASGQVRLTNTDGGKMTKAAATTAMAETKTLRASSISRESIANESALEGAKRVDDQIWSDIRNGNKEAATTILVAMGQSEAEGRAWINEHANAASAMNKRHVHILAEAGEVCVAEAVHYLVTFTNNGRDWNESNSGYWLYLRKVDGKWEPSTFTDAETDALNQLFYQHYKPEAIESAMNGGNMATFGNMMWTQPDGVEDGVYTATVTYAYQAENRDVSVFVALANGTKEIKQVTKIGVTITDKQLGQILKVSEGCNVSVLPGTVEIYEIRIPAGKVKKGTWTSMSGDVHTEY